MKDMTINESARHNIKNAKKYGKPTNDVVELAVLAIIYDLSDRRGLKHEWVHIDEDIQKEIKDIWIEIIKEAMREG